MATNIKRVYEPWSKQDGFTITLLYGSKDEEQNHARLLLELIGDMPAN